MKRGLIAWDRDELPPAVFEERLARARRVLADKDLPALVVYSDVWRSNHARFLTNFMPYWNRSLVVIPREAPPVLLCGLSPRVYPWIRSVTVFDEIRPAGKLVPALGQLCTERAWKRIGVLDLPRIAVEIDTPLRQAGLGIEPVTIAGLCADDAEIAMRRRAAHLARQILEQELPHGAGTLDYQFAGHLEGAFRRAGAEDLVVLLSASGSTPRPAHGATMGREYSAAVALEYRGHWVKIVRAHAEDASLKDRFDAALHAATGPVENLSGPYPWEGCERPELPPGAIFALHVADRGLYYGDTCAGEQTL